MKNKLNTFLHFLFKTIITLVVILTITIIFIFKINNPFTISAREYLFKIYKGKAKIKVPNEYSKVDINKNNIPDPIDIVTEARKEVERKTPYRSAYYVGGYPPQSEGVCTDVIWRAFKSIDVNLKDLVDKDIKENVKLYLRVNGKPDPHIDFRRVPNLDVFFKRHAESLTTEIKPWDIENLKQWQPGDIVVILEPYEHIGIISDKQSNDGIPYFIHNSTPHASESAHFNLWNCKIKAHYRWKYANSVHCDITGNKSYPTKVRKKFYEVSTPELIKEFEIY